MENCTRKYAIAFTYAYKKYVRGIDRNKNAYLMEKILFEYYWDFKNYKNTWQNYIPYNTEHFVLDDDEVIGVIDEFLFIKILNNFTPDEKNESNVFMYVTDIMNKQFAGALAKIANPIYIPHTTDKRFDDYVKDSYNQKFYSYDDIEEIDLKQEDFLDDIPKKIELKQIIKETMKLQYGSLVLMKLGFFSNGKTMTVREICEVTGFTKKTVNYWINKNINQLKEMYKK